MPRTPVIGKLPKILVRKSNPIPTPVIDGIAAKPVAELIELDLLSDADIKAAVQVAGVASEHDPGWNNIHTECLKHSCAYFASEIIRGPKEEPYRGKFLLGPHHLEWDDLIVKYNRLCILAARDHGKSFFYTIAYSIWKSGFNDAGSQGVIFSATQPQAEEFLGKIKDELLSNPKLAHLVPYTGDRFWSAKRIRLRNGSIIKAAGFGVKVRGGHPDWAVCDDILNDDDIYSETIRRRNIDYFLSAIAGMVHRRKQLIVVGTPMHHGDLYAALRESGEYTCRSYPARDPKTGVPLWPQRYSEEDLQAKRRELKSESRFAREYLCQPLSDEASLFPSKLFEGSARLPYVLGLPGTYWIERGCVLYSGVDIALSAETGGDYFVIVTIAVDTKGVRYIANIRRGKGWSFRRQIDEIKEEYCLMRPDSVHIEANQMQRVWSDELVDTSDVPVRKFFTTGIGGSQPERQWKRGATSVAVNKHHIDRGVPSLRMLFEHGKVRIPRGDERSIAETDVWMGEFQAIGWINGRVQSVGEHDDCVMATWMCDTAVRMGGFGDYDFGSDKVSVQPVQDEPTEPVIDESAIVNVDYLESERKALAACQEEREVDIDRSSYLARVRGQMRTYAEELMSSGSTGHARFVLTELQRLDTVHKFRAYDSEFRDVANHGAAEYRDSWRPPERAPTPGELSVG